MANALRLSRPISTYKVPEYVHDFNVLVKEFLVLFNWWLKWKEKQLKNLNFQTESFKQKKCIRKSHLQWCAIEMQAYYLNII